ncbi:LuxR C-terminal-related transcriptional regulator [Streptomyces sp. NPDC050504]|uniref:helix-turn-helix transcriptional regulator n=1 Tax=Streptomyces sp. NPDC050504 TaxID=3365618 RepID=UPI0037A8B108
MATWVDAVDSVESVSRSAPREAARAEGVEQLGGELSRMLGRVVPHDGYLLTGYDPVTGARCFLACENAYGAGARRRMDQEDALGLTRGPVARLVDGASPVVVLGSGARDAGPGERRLHDIMAADCYGSEMCVMLRERDLSCGTLVLLRERGARPFSPADAARAAELAGPLALAVRRFVTGRAPRPRRTHFPPVVVLVGQDDEVKGVTAAGREALRGLLPGVYPAGDRELFGFARHLICTARRTGEPALTRAPTSLGWFSLQAQPWEGRESGEVVVTLQPAPPADLLPALVRWYGISARERTVIEQVLEGQAAKQIARRLGLSPHTVNDHFKSVYRKTGVGSREELLAWLLRG